MTAQWTGITTAVDDRFRRLLPETDWLSLPAAVRERFTRPIAPGQIRIFSGRVIWTEHSRMGWILAQMARLVGGPLPHARDGTGPSTVVVIDDPSLGGQIWTRSYARPGRFPQTISSVKRFAGPTGLEEHLGCGLTMRLRLSVENGALVFRSAGYDLQIAGRRFAVPVALSPGCCSIVHRDEGGGRFAFSLTLDHPRLGRLLHQIAVFEEVNPAAGPAGTQVAAIPAT